ncbi:unnamed protein product [Closterium sp. Yama58-4]|nr:unnamed protein product [Closterium sp. Yama58-4]
MVDRSIAEFFVLGRELGRGEFGVTCLATSKATGEQVAVKSIPKRKLKTAVDIEDVRREVAIMHHLPPHPNIVGLKGVFEDRHAVHIVQELCEGGELFERIIARGHYSERAAAVITRTIVEVVQVCHKHGVMHRDLKPENFLFANNQEDAALRAIDFGLSIMFKPGETLSEIVGSPYYMAPEVLRKNYGPLADVWSAGVILYILLCGVPPFWAETEQGVAQAVLRSQVDLKRDPWPKVSDGAKHLVMLMLQPDTSKRPTAQQVLQHPWLRDANEAPDTPLGVEVLSRMQSFQAMNKLKKKALKVIADQLSSAEELQGLQEVFKIIDENGDGTLTLEELRNGLRRIGSPLSDAEVQALMDAADIDGNGEIDYSEFVAATMHLQRVDNEKNLQAAFDYFDSDRSGFIDIEELADALGADLTSLKEILAEAAFDYFDSDRSGFIDIEELADALGADLTSLKEILAEVDTNNAAFDYFDSDRSGFIDIEELADALGADLTSLKEILAEVDTNNQPLSNHSSLCPSLRYVLLSPFSSHSPSLPLTPISKPQDGKISFDEFKVMMRKGTDLRGSLRHFSKSRSSLRALLKLSEIDLAGGPTDGTPANS